MKISADDLVRIISYCSLIHHTNGRLRVRINKSVQNEIKNLNLSDDDLQNLQNLLKNIEGLKSAKLNKIVASLTIEYDDKIFAKSFWDDMLNGKNLDFAVNKINEKLKDIK